MCRRSRIAGPRRPGTFREFNGSPVAVAAPHGKITRKALPAREKGGATTATVRELALALPEVVDTSRLRGIAFKARGKLLACKAIHRSAEPESLVVRVGSGERDRLIAAAPGIYYLTPHYLNSIECVLVRLAKVDAKALAALFANAREFVAGKAAAVRKTPRKKRAVSIFRYLCLAF